MILNTETGVVGLQLLYVGMCDCSFSMSTSTLLCTVDMCLACVVYNRVQHIFRVDDVIPVFEGRTTIPN